MEEYGFVYIWFDRKHKRYYIGCRWGRTDDGYLCSSNWMKRAYKRRPQDFKRRILEYVNTNRQDLLEREYYWLSQIKPNELRIRYYNIQNRKFNHWSVDPNQRLSVAQKVSRSRRKLTNLGWWSRGKKFSQEHRQKLSEQKKGNTYRRGKKHSEQTRLKMSQAKKGSIPWNKGLTYKIK